jgi:iron only hydrogenase large subunit-like protein
MTVWLAGTLPFPDKLTCVSSGCITSAESILISQQSTAEVTSTIEREMALPPQSRARFVASLSPQSRASIAAYCNISMQSAYLKLHTFFTQVLPFEAVFDTNLGREISLVEGVREFQSRWTAKQTGAVSPPLPVICASCPGWVCYAEKTHHGILPYLSTTRSPQQIMGTMIKRKFSREWGVSASKIWHLSVMPCFDKKLEASRDDFTDGDGVRDVDCVITTAELIKMIESYGMTVPELPESTTLSSIETRMTSHAGSSSGGYLFYLMTVSAKSLFGLDVDIANARGVQIKTVRSGDMVEYTLTENGQTKLRMAQCYGFRNIQNLVRKLEGKKTKVVKKKNNSHDGGADQWDYVEVMACPSGCINGGGQIPTANNGERTFTPREWVHTVEQVYQSQSVEWPSEERVAEIYKEWFGEEPESCRKRFVETEYHGVDFTLENPLLLGSRW